MVMKTRGTEVRNTESSLLEESYSNLYHPTTTIKTSEKGSYIKAKYSPL